MNLTEQLRAIHEAADPQCQECGGEGLVSIAINGDPDREQDVACDCAKHALDGMDEPHGPREAD